MCEILLNNIIVDVYVAMKTCLSVLLRFSQLSVNVWVLGLDAVRYPSSLLKLLVCSAQFVNCYIYLLIRVILISLCVGGGDIHPYVLCLFQVKKNK